MTSEDKLKFLLEGSFEQLKGITEASTATWGVMTPQQMIEHVADFFDVSAEKIKMKLHTPEEHLPKYKEFLMSEKEFRENTKAPTEVLDKPLPLRTANLTEATAHFKKSVNDFTEYFKEDRKTLHPVFGMLNHDEWIRLHYKHVLHHLKQFGLERK